MGRETVLMKSEEPMSRQQIAAFLHTLADKVASGTVTLRQGDDELVLAVPSSPVLEIQVEDELKGGKKARAQGRTRTQRSIEVEISWYEGEEAPGGVEIA
jgi:amphi-Trp domain-containing protein